MRTGTVQKRPIDHTYKEAGSFGRTQFCRFDVNVDKSGSETVNDEIIVALDIKEA